MDIESEIKVGLAQQQTRRAFLGRTAHGVGKLALASLLSPGVMSAFALDSAKAKYSGVVQPLHYPPKVKRVIWLTMAGGPSHLETFDFKPKLLEMHGKPMPESMTKGQQLAQLQGKELLCFGPQH